MVVAHDCRYVNVMLRRACQGGILYSPCRKAFISRANNPFKAEEYSDISGELRWPFKRGGVTQDSSHSRYPTPPPLTDPAPPHPSLTLPLLIPPELMALAELIGPYGIRLVGEKLMEQISSQTKEIKRLVVANKDTLLSMLQNKDKPELFQEAARRLRSEGRG